MTYVPAAPAEYNAIKINISGAKVDAPHGAMPTPPAPPVQQNATQSLPAPVPAQVGNNLNINA